MSVSQSLYLSIYLNVPSLALLCFPLFVIVPSFHCFLCLLFILFTYTPSRYFLALPFHSFISLGISFSLSTPTFLSFSFLSLSLSLFLHLHFSLFLLFLSTPRFSLSLPPHSLHSTPSLCSLSLPRPSPHTLLPPAQWASTGGGGLIPTCRNRKQVHREGGRSAAVTWLPTVTSEGRGAEAALPRTRPEGGHPDEAALAPTLAALHCMGHTAHTSSPVAALTAFTRWRMTL